MKQKPFVFLLLNFSDICFWNLLEKHVIYTRAQQDKG